MFSYILKNSFLRLLLLFTVYFTSCNFILSQHVWTSFVDSVSTLSSPRAIDLNSDGIKDIVVGAGTDSTFSNYGILAFDGLNGQQLWHLPTPDEVFTSAIFQDINNDQVPEIFMGGRNAQLYAINGATGQIIWEHFPQNVGLNPVDSGLYNFYSAQFLPDMNGDNVNDLLVANGGDHKASPFDPRPPGHLMIINGVDGSLIAKAVMPDSGEIYCSPVLYDRMGALGLCIVFGTGGEHFGGSMYVTTLPELMNNDISNAIVLSSSPNKGFIAPASIADVTNDGFLDIIIQSFDGEISAYDGLSWQQIWAHSMLGCESSAAPTLGNFTGGDLIPDVFTVMYRGSTPTYFEYYQMMIDGTTGEVKWLDSIGDMHFPSSVAFDANADGRDEVVFSVNYAPSSASNYFSHQLKIIDFQTDTIYDITPLEPGINLASTPLIDDLDHDGLIDLIYTYKEDSLNPSAWNGFNINRINTTYQYPYRGLAWGAYMGTSFDGHYNSLLSNCTSSSLISSWNIDHPSCNLFSDGSISPSQIVSTPNTYLWSNGTIEDSLSNLLAGSYTVYVTDTNNCLETHQFQLNDPYLISFGNVNHNTCFGDSMGSVTVASTGCVCQFSSCTYSWTSGSLIKHATQLPAGMQTVVLTHADGCVVTDSIYINDGIPVIDTSFSSNMSCYYVADGSINLIPTDTSFTTYSWSNGSNLSVIDHLNSGDYSVLVSNLNCSDSLYFTIDQPDTVTLNHTVTHLNCYADSSGLIELFPTVGNSPFTFHFNGNLNVDSVFSNLSIGNYEFFIVDASNCSSDTTSVVINQPDSLFMSYGVIPESDSGYFDGSINISVLGGTPPYVYDWDDFPATNDSSVIYLSNGYYYVEVSDMNGCQISDSIHVGLLSSINELGLNLVNVYPMPSTGQFFLENKTNHTYEIVINDLSGRLIGMPFILSPYKSELQNLPTGHYTIVAKSKTTMVTKQIVIVK